MLLGYTRLQCDHFPVALRHWPFGRRYRQHHGGGEQAVFAGLNSQVNITGYAYGYRWGDYSSTVLDPDDCTFWYTNEYEKHAGLFNWSTRVFNWNFGTSNCTSLGIHHLCPSRTPRAAPR